jgi:hypothetical protein
LAIVQGVGGGILHRTSGAGVGCKLSFLDVLEAAYGHEQVS